MATKKWTIGKAVEHLLELKDTVFANLRAGDECDGKSAKLAIDIIKELNAISGLNGQNDDKNTDRELEVKITVVEGEGRHP